MKKNREPQTRQMWLKAKAAARAATINAVAAEAHQNEAITTEVAFSSEIPATNTNTNTNNKHLIQSQSLDIDYIPLEENCNSNGNNHLNNNGNNNNNNNSYKKNTDELNKLKEENRRLKKALKTVNRNFSDSN